MESRTRKVNFTEICEYKPEDECFGVKRGIGGDFKVWKYLNGYGLLPDKSLLDRRRANYKIYLAQSP